MRRTRFVVLLGLIGALVLVGASLAVADDNGGKKRVKSERLSGYHEVPALSSSGTGSFRAEIAGNGQSIAYELRYSGLATAVSAAHIHFAQRDVNGGVSAFLCGGGDKPACPATAGTVEGVIDPADVVGPAAQGVEPGSFAELVRAMRVGATYANVHTPPRWPGGEIRGQIRGGGDDDDDD